MAVTGTGGAHGTRNWRRYFFYAVEVTFAIIAGTAESWMYAAYLEPGPLRWPEAIARATITQIIIILFGVAAIEAWRMRNGAARVFFTLVIWAVTIGAGSLTFWFLWEAAQVFRDTVMLAPLQHATISLPTGATIPNWMIDVTLIAALPFFQTVLNILAPIITADHAPETLEQQRERQQREEAQAAHKARMTALKAQGIGAAIGGGFKAAKAQVTGEDTAGYDDGKPTGSDDPNMQVPGGDTAGYDSGSGQAAMGAKAPVSIKRGQWTSRDLIDYAKREHHADVSDIEARRAMAILSDGVKRGNAYVASSRTVKAWVDRNYGSGNGDAIPTGTGER